MALTGRAGLVALAGALVVGLLVPSALGLLADTGLLLVLLATDVALAGPVRPLVMSRTGDTAVRLGEVAEVALTVANPSGRRVRGLLRDAWPPSAGAAVTRHPVDLRPGERARVTTVLEPTRRGDRPAHRVTVRSVGPLGLAARQGWQGVPWRVRVLPPFHSRRHLPAALSRLRELDGRAAALVRGQGTEFDSLREYVVGDDVRSIDWRASARAADVVVRTWRPERDRRIVLVLDTGRTSAGRVGDAPRLDAAMDAALLLAALASRAGDRVDLLAYDRRVRARVEGAGPTTLLPRLVEAMAPIEPTLVEPDYAGMVAEVMTRWPRRSLVVLLTALDPAPVEEGLLPVLARVVQRHRLLVASVGDPRVEAMRRGRGDAESVYGAAAAERAQLDRERLAELLRRRGAEVVDAPPEALPPALADRYLSLKAAGRL
ncbi:MAG: hypothetical protein QOE01_3247 [Actinomycetota bacterium]|nr:hypothetical protein [Actinomycetota bacterium]